MKDEAIFRTAALLYADNNYEVKTSRIMKKLIESLFVETSNKRVDINGLLDLANENYSLEFSKKEFENTILEYSDGFEIDYKDGNICCVCLTNKRYDVLLEKLATNNVAKYIDEFISDNGYSTKEKDIIYKFLHYILNTNVLNFNNFTDSKAKLDEINVENYEFSIEETSVINKFLAFERQGKNKAIYDIVSYSLEYCLLTGDGNPIYKEGLRNKNLYLDTNIIFRAIGLNGDMRKKRTQSFLKKCLNTGQRIVISKYSEQEFFQTIKKKIVFCLRKSNPKFDGKLYSKYTDSKDIYLYYLKWVKCKTNTSLELFESHIRSEYDRLIKKYNIDRDYKGLGKSQLKYINEISASLETFKNKTDKMNTDAMNIMLIRQLRHNTNSNYKRTLETPYFLISTDYSLMNFCINQFEDETIICMLPSYWYTILLRYSGRTEDDFKSFVSFLNLQSSEKIINNDKIFAVLSGISEITDDISQQEYYADEIIKNGVNGIIKDVNINEVFEETVEYVESDLIDRVSRVEKELQEYTAESKKESDEKIKEISELNYQCKKEKDDKTQLMDIVVSEKIKKWKVRGVVTAIIISVLLIGIIVDLLFLHNTSIIIIDEWITNSNSILIQTLASPFILIMFGIPYKLVKSRMDDENVSKMREKFKMNYINKLK